MATEKIIYDDMWRDFSRADTYQYDAMINQPSDTRRGITALSYLHHSRSLTEEITDFQQQLKALEPKQYYQPESDLHLTVLSIVTCSENYIFTNNSEQDYAEVFKKAVHDAGSFSIQFKGITASPSCILLQGFMPDELLLSIREKLREAFKQSPLHSSIDSRYKIETAHSTIVRFTTPMIDPVRLFEFIKRYRNYEFGSHQVDKLNLVFNNWYQQKEHTKPLAEVRLSATT